MQSEAGKGPGRRAGADDAAFRANYEGIDWGDKRTPLTPVIIGLTPNIVFHDECECKRPPPIDYDYCDWDVRQPRHVRWSRNEREPTDDDSVFGAVILVFIVAFVVLAVAAASGVL